MKRFWFEFHFNYNDAPPPGTQLGCGVTALDYNQAVAFLRQKIFINRDLPEIKNVIENVNINELDQGHIIPNMSPPNILGIWFPLGYN